MIYSPGDVIISSYTDMKGATSEALFIVVYNEAIDSKVKPNRNLLVAKLTTNYNFYDCYSHALDKNSYPFLKRACYVRINKLNTIDTVQVIRYLGELKYKDRQNIIKLFNKFTKEIVRQNKIGGHNNV